MNKWFTSIGIALSIVTQATDARSFNTEQWETSNGAKVVFYAAKEVPMLDINIAFAAGSAYDGQQFGLSALTARLLAQGNGTLDANQIAEKLADTGAQYDNESSRDMAAFSLKTLTEETALNSALATFALIINKPNFKQDAFNREKNQQIAAILQAQQSPDEIANQVFFTNLYKKHPYAHPVNGTLDTVKKISVWQVRDFYKHYYVARNAVIVLVGAIDSNKAHQIAEQLVQSLPAGNNSTPIAKAEPLTSAETIKINFPSSQTMLRLGQIGIEHSNPEYFPLMVGNYILGGGALVSRLSNEVREKRGLTYGITSQFLPMPGDGPFIISLSTKNSQAANALEVTQNIVAKFLTSGPGEEELTAAKQYLVGSFPLSLASNSSIANMLLRLNFYHLPDHYLDTYTANIEAVTSAQIKQAFDQTIHPEKLLQVSVGKQ